MVQYYLYSDTLDQKIFTLLEGDYFDKGHIKKEIIKHLSIYKDDTLEWCKVNNNPETVGDDIIEFYENNPINGEPSKLILKGNREFYKKIR